MGYFYFLFFIRLVILVMLFHIYEGCASFKCSQCDSFDFYFSENKENRLSLKCLWSDVVGCGSCGFYVDLYSVCEGSHIFVTDYHGVVKKLNINTGKCVWSKKLSDVLYHGFFLSSDVFLLSGGIAFNKNHLYFGSELSKVYALDANTGSILWISKVSGEVISKPIISRGLVLVYTSNGVFQALDERNGIIRWSLNFEVPDFSFRATLLPVISGDFVILGDPGGIVSVCYVDTGELVWQKKISVLKGVTDLDRLSNVIAPVVIDNVVYSTAYNGNIEALDIFSGSLIWSRNIGSLINIIVEGNFIYLIDQDSRVIALNRSNGNIIWSKSNLMCRQLISIALYKSYILIGDAKGYLCCLYKENGVFLGKKKISVGSLNHLVITFNKIVFYENNGRLSVWGLLSNTL